MNDIALITGASSGIGYELAILFAKKKTDILIIARNEQRLLNIKKNLENEYQIKVYTVASDLSTPKGVNDVLNFVKDNRLNVSYLINNAGFGDYGSFIERNIENYSEMISVNITSLTSLTHYFAKEMVRNGKGRILNIASTAGFQPDPCFAVYGATKAYVINFTEALHKELEKTGVTVTVLSPGATRTEFMERAEMSNSKLFNGSVMSAKEVAKVGFEGMMKGKLHVIPGFKNRILAFFSSITPSSKLRLNISARVMGQKVD
jgi:short-subunit dehydrogenase